MKLLRGLTPIPALSSGSVVTIGNFDGVHSGHQALLLQLKKESLLRKLPMVVIIFEPQPAEFFRGQDAPARLTRLREKLTQFKRLGVDFVYCLHFNNACANMTAQEFANTYFFSLLQAQYILVGKDFRFGKNRQGDVGLLTVMAAVHRCTVNTFSDFNLDSFRVSSTYIRNALKAGQMQQAAYFLGRPFSFSGRVVRGDGRGREWGIPTANLTMSRFNLPVSGVFCVQVKRENGALLNGVANIGRRPTVDGSHNVLEVHLFDFDSNIYGERLQVELLHKLRDEIRFSSIAVLIEQIRQDILAAKSFFAKDSQLLIESGVDADGRI